MSRMIRNNSKTPFETPAALLDWLAGWGIDKRNAASLRPKS
jgi:hypothetical protein